MSGRRRISPRRKAVRAQRRRAYKRIRSLVDRAAVAAVFHLLSIDPSAVRIPDACFPCLALDGRHTPDSRGYCTICHRLIEED